MREMLWDSGFSSQSGEINCGRKRTGRVYWEREERPLQGVFTLHVTDLQQRLASCAGVYRI